MSQADPGLTDLAAWYAEAMAACVLPQNMLGEQVADPTLPARCCQKATQSALDYFCTCRCVTECPDHGEQHHGTHD